MEGGQVPQKQKAANLADPRWYTQRKKKQKPSPAQTT